MEEKIAKEEKKEVHRCDQCKWYDASTQRDFHRAGIRKGLVEIRAICRSPTSNARNHLVKNDSDRPCFEEGKYTAPEKPETKKKKESTVITNRLNGQVKRFVRNGSKTILVEA